VKKVPVFTRIVVGDDGSPQGRDAVVLGAAIARVTGAGLTLLQAYPPFPISIEGHTDRETQTRNAHAQLARHRDRYAADAHVEVVWDSQPARALSEYAERWHADLLVIGSARHAPTGHCALGQTGRGLIERAPAALAVAEQGLHEHGIDVSKIAVGFDGGPESELALRLADEIASAADAELLIESLVRAHGELSERDRLDALELCRRAALGTAARSRADARVGEPGPELRTLSEELDLMVIGSRRWGALARVVLGGVGEALATDCASSLLVTCRALRHPTPVTVPTFDSQEDLS
jgi:nucleotide-binding universal stress UspA family protein